MIVRLPFTFQEMHSIFLFTVQETFKATINPESKYQGMRKDRKLFFLFRIIKMSYRNARYYCKEKFLSALSEYHNFSCHLVPSSFELGSKKQRAKFVSRIDFCNEL